MVPKTLIFCVFNPTMSNISMGVKIMVRANSWEEGSECSEGQVFDVISGNMIRGVHCSHQINMIDDTTIQLEFYVSGYSLSLLYLINISFFPYQIHTLCG